MVAHMNDTRITFPYFPYTAVLDAGQSAESDVSPSRFAARYNSSNPTLLVQYNMGQQDRGDLLY